MANITDEILDITSEERGEDVRDAFTNACEKIADELLPDASNIDYVATVNSSGKWEAMPWT